MSEMFQMFEEDKVPDYIRAMDSIRDKVRGLKKQPDRRYAAKRNIRIKARN